MAPEALEGFEGAWGFTDPLRAKGLGLYDIVYGLMVCLTRAIFWDPHFVQPELSEGAS